LGLVGAAGYVTASRARPGDTVWQLDPDKCTKCGNCETHCVLDVSAVKAVQCFELCGYCDVCTGYFPAKGYELDTGAKNQLCPTGAIVRRYIPDDKAEKAGVRYFEYTIDEPLCIGCGKCVEGCELMNGSLYLQVRHDLCLNCNECSIAVACPAQAFRRVPAAEPAILKKLAQEAVQQKAGNE
jgi:electron transport complex protein RnfB